MGESYPQKHKLRACLLCDKCSYNTGNQDVYTQTVLSHLIPEQFGGDQKSQIFDFCIDCIGIAEDLLQLNERLELTLQNMNKKILEIKCLILKSIERPSSDAFIEAFRQTAVKDVRPIVDMCRNNIILASPNIGKENYKDLGQNENTINSVNKETNSPVNPKAAQNSKVIPQAQKFNELSNICDSKPDNAPKITQEPNPPLLTIVPTPIPFPKVVTSPRFVEAANLTADVEDSVIVITEPPLFNKDQSEMYYDKYRTMYKCKFCSIIVKAKNDIETLSGHINVIHALNSRFKCAICLEVFFSRNKCRSHIQETHLIDSITAQENERMMNIGTKNVEKRNPPLTVLMESQSFFELNNGIEVTSMKGDPLSNKKIRPEVMIKIISKNSYDFIEDAVTFEPWVKSSTDNNVKPFMEQDNEDSNTSVEESGQNSD